MATWEQVFLALLGLNLELPGNLSRETCHLSHVS